MKNKNAIIYGAAGSLGTAISKAFAEAGANVFLSGHNLAAVQQLANQIIASGGRAEARKVDALNQKEVNEFVNYVYSKTGSVDISFDVISLHDKQNIPLVDLDFADFIRPISIAMETQFYSCTAAAKAMIKQGHGVILLLTATPGGIGYANTGGFGPACMIMEAFARNLASEVGANGVRVVAIRSGGSPDSKVFKEAIDQGGPKVEQFIHKMANDTMLKKMPLMKDIANVSVFAASEMAAMVTGTTIDVTSGTTAALNYKVTNIAFLEK